MITRSWRVSFPVNVTRYMESAMVKTTMLLALTNFDNCVDALMTLESMSSFILISTLCNLKIGVSIVPCLLSEELLLVSRIVLAIMGPSNNSKNERADRCQQLKIVLYTAVQDGINVYTRSCKVRIPILKI